MGKNKLKRLNFNTMIKGEKPVSKDIRQIVSQKWVCIFEKGISRDLSTSLTGEWEYINGKTVHVLS